MPSVKHITKNRIESTAESIASIGAHYGVNGKLLSTQYKEHFSDYRSWDQLERETEAINSFIVKKRINVISEEQFAKQGNTTDATKNQYVLFPNTGVYMQIVEKGTD